MKQMVLLIVFLLVVHAEEISAYDRGVLQKESVGQPLPFEYFTDEYGADVSFNQIRRGNYTLAVTHVQWCRPSRNFLQMLSGLDKRVVVLHMEQETPTSILPDAINLYYKSDSQWCFSDTVPHYFLLDQDGNIISYGCGFKGEHHPLTATMISVIRNDLHYPDRLADNQFAYTVAYGGPKEFPEDTKWGDAKLMFSAYSKGRYTLTFDKPLTVIGAKAFMDCRNLLSVDLPSNLTSISESAFRNCFRLKEVIFPDNLNYIRSCAFSNCHALREVQIPDRVIEIDANAFAHCYGMEKLRIGYYVRSIDCYAFNGCKALQKIVVPPNVSDIGVGAFGGCSGELIIQSKVVETYDAWLEESAFRTITIGGGVVTKIGKGVFSGYKTLEMVKIMDGVTEIGEYAFNGCSNLKEITLPTNLDRIGEYAFKLCSSLEHVVLPRSINKISSSLFAGCSKLNNVQIPDNVTEIEGFAFENCLSLTEIILPDSITDISPSAFRGCDNLEGFKSKYASEDGRCFIVNGVLKCFLPHGLNEYTVPFGVTTLANACFGSCTELKYINLPATLTYIGDYSFSNTNLNVIRCQASKAPEIGYSIFHNVNPHMKIFVPARSAGNYKRNWKEYKEKIVKIKKQH